MADTYWTGWIENSSLANVAAYIEKNLNGVSQERIVSITHTAQIVPGHSFYSAVIVLKNP
jgi:predicted thioesterase